MKLLQSKFYKILKETFVDYFGSSASKDSTSIAYYAIFSIPGLLIIVMWISGNIFGMEAMQGQINESIGGVMGADVSKSLEDMIVGAHVDGANWWMKIIGIATLVFGATTLFFKLQQGLNDIWEVEPAPKRAWLKFIMDRATSLGLIIIIAFLLLITSVLTTVLGLASGWITDYFGVETVVFAQIGNFLVSLAVIVLLFAVMFKLFPDVNLPWKSVWIGALVTAFLFDIGKFLLGLYFSNAEPTSIFGAAGTVILIMMWINYSCQLIFFGATFTKVFAKVNGYNVQPSKFAKWNAARTLEEQTRKS